jgi:hypothetical protein
MRQKKFQFDAAIKSLAGPPERVGASHRVMALIFDV